MFTVHLVVLPVPDVLPAVSPEVVPFPANRVVPELPLVAGAVRSTELPISVLLPFEEVPLEYRAIFPALSTVPVFQTKLPLPSESRVPGN